MQTQEIPSLLVAGFLCWRAGPASFLAHPTSARTLMAAGFLGHYVYRSLIYPFRLRRYRIPNSCGTVCGVLGLGAEVTLMCSHTCWDGASACSLY